MNLISDFKQKNETLNKPALHLAQRANLYLVTCLSQIAVFVYDRDEESWPTERQQSHSVLSPLPMISLVSFSLYLMKR